MSGVAALLWSYNTTAPVEHIHNALLAGAEDLGPLGHDDKYGWGLVQALDAFETLKRTLSGEEGLRNWDTTLPICGEGEMLVQVDLKTDRYGNETAWVIFR